MEHKTSVLPLGQAGPGSRSTMSWFDLLYPRTSHPKVLGELNALDPGERLQLLLVASSVWVQLYPAFFDTHHLHVQYFVRRMIKDRLPLRIRHQAHVDVACRDWVGFALLATRVPFRLNKKKAVEFSRQVQPALEALEKAVAAAQGSPSSGTTTTTTTTTSTTTTSSKSSKSSALSRLDKLAGKIKKHLHLESATARPTPNLRLIRLARMRFEDDFHAIVFKVWPEECSAHVNDVVALVPTVLDESVSTFDVGKTPGFEWMAKQGFSLEGGASDAARSLHALVCIFMRPIARRAIDRLQSLLTDPSRRDELAMAQAEVSSNGDREALENVFLLESLRLVVVEMDDARDWPPPVRAVVRSLCQAIDWQADRVKLTKAEVLRFKALILRYVLMEAFKPYFDACEGSRWMPRLLAWMEEAMTFLLPQPAKDDNSLDLKSFLHLQGELEDARKNEGIERTAVANLRAAFAILARQLLGKKA